MKWIKIYLILIGISIYYIGLKQTYTLQTVLEVGKIAQFAKCLEFTAFKDGGSVKTVFLKLNGFNGFRNKL